MKITARDAANHPHLEKHVGKVLAGHKVVVEGFYLAAPNKRDASGHFEKRKVKYREEFTLAAHEHRSAAQGALGHLLSDKILAQRLSEKDPDFRAISTHQITSHVNILEMPKVVPPAPAAEEGGDELEPPAEENLPPQP